MGKGAGEEWDERPSEEKYPDTVQSQPKKSKERSSGGGCPTCCVKTKNCLMSPECGRALQISSVVAMCGMCLRMFVCEWQSYYTLMSGKDTAVTEVKSYAVRMFKIPEWRI